MPLVLLVDETRIGGRFRAMAVGVAYKRRCIQLAWTCYKARSREDHPIEGQVGMIAAMLAQLKTVLPDDRPVMGLADRGIGNSTALCKAVEALGWHYLFRVPKTVKIKTDGGILHPHKEVNKGDDGPRADRSLSNGASLGRMCARSGSEIAPNLGFWSPTIRP